MAKRCLVITSSFPRGERDLAGKFVEQWCCALARQGWRVDVLCWRGPGAVNRRVMPGVEVRFVAYGPPRWEGLFFGAGAPENLEASPGRAVMGAPAMASMVVAAVGACRRRRYDRIVGHWLVPGGLVARLVGAMTNIPSAVVGHSGGVHLLGSVPGGLGAMVARWACGGATTLPSEPLRDRLRELSKINEVEVAPMGFSPGDGGARRARRARLEVGFLGRLVPIKGLETAIDAVEIAGAEGTDLRLTVVGEGPERTRWEARAGDHVEFVGPRYGAEKWGFLKSWDVLVMPSKELESGRHEGLPVSLLEGAHAGAVPLVSGIPGVERWLARPDRQVLRGGDARELAARLQWLAKLEGGERRQLASLTRRQVAPLSWPDYGRWWSQWLEEVPKVGVG